jgi:hypothetical protein
LSSMPPIVTGMFVLVRVAFALGCLWPRSVVG